MEERSSKKAEVAFVGAGSRLAVTVAHAAIVVSHCEAISRGRVPHCSLLAHPIQCIVDHNSLLANVDQVFFFHRRCDDVAKFWLRFLGCQLSEKPRVRTTRFFETVESFINEVVTDPVEKNTIY